MKKIFLVGTLVGLASLALILGGCDKKEVKGKIEDGKITESSTSLSDGQLLETNNISLKDDGYFKEVVTGKEDPKVKLEVEYKTDWKDSSWEDINFEIDRLKVVEVDKIKDKDENTYKGLLSLHFYVENKGKEEVRIHPDEAKVLLNDGTEIKGDGFVDYWEDIFEKDKKKDGYVHFKFDELGQVDNIKEIDVTFKGEKKNKNKETVNHEYKVPLPLEIAE